MSSKTKKPATKKKTEKQMAKELLNEADDILQEVSEAVIFKTKSPLQFPTFERTELKFGNTLGVGGFCLVSEVAQIKLKAEEGSIQEAIMEPSPMDGPEEEYYDLATARRRMSKYCLRDGDARYAVKQLHVDLSELERARGMIDLAIEAKFLSVISHPNIIKMRAVAAIGPMSKDCYLVLDRLYGTLEDKVLEWKQEKKSKNGFLKFGKDKEALNELLLDRLLVAYDLSSAFAYIQQNKLVYRDIKLENIGFDVRGDVKVFDFGLCKNLHPKVRTGSDGMYKLTPMVGSFPYMAPEVALGKPYNSSADVFSYGMLLWEIFALQLPFKGYTRKEYYTTISVQGARPPISKSWPDQASIVIKNSWSIKPKERPDFRRIGSMLRTDLSTMSQDDQILNRSHHIRNKSRRSIYLRGSITGNNFGNRDSFMRKSTATLHGVKGLVE